jgi:hypothetical protein
VSNDATTGQTEISVTASNQTYLVQRRGNELVIGRQAGATVLWQDETVPVDDLPDDARSALEAGDTSSEPLARALEAVVQAFVQRGG